ncbi:small, acid-soluble spore protein L [Siminovitchia acidinfaciens]|uniref:Small, acid-soluble spore protein L n=1 Tax=Siminovitchia acidinfaciens TaxID=2321395 RepID=A0A429XZB2_9BACI|nr:small, acid-soluble spore protein L [Siminovitchia acidinfaciens]RST74097.1 small, acid-soluble spore protein L [Siminovitchia acidinfaciens]VEF49520.1 Small, acid-soluble spore protein L [Bacillus freudenreichii]
MKRDDNVRSNKRVVSSVNPQGLTEDVANQAPKTQLEERAKKSNTKI